MGGKEWDDAAGIVDIVGSIIYCSTELAFSIVNCRGLRDVSYSAGGSCVLEHHRVDRTNACHHAVRL